MVAALSLSRSVFIGIVYNLQLNQPFSAMAAMPV